jgi:hypothetical protein
MCDNRVPYIVPSGYDYKTLDYKCGSTGIHGEAVMCDECETRISLGRMNRPGHCKHGVALSTDDGRDITCSTCEFGD